MQSLRQKAHETFMGALRTKQLEPGRTYTQAELCRLLSVSTSPLQAALKSLETEGFVEIKSRSGIQIKQPDLADFRECQQLRKLLEMAGIGPFALTEPLEKLDKLKSDVTLLMTSAQDGGNPKELAALYDDIERRLHEGIIGALGNRTIMRIYRTNMDRFRLMQREGWTLSTDHFVTASQEHLAIIEAACARDAKAAEIALTQHISLSLERAIMTSLFSQSDVFEH